MLEKESATSLAIRLCERLGIKYHLGDGISTLNGEVYDFENETGPFEVGDFFTTIEIREEKPSTKIAYERFDDKLKMEKVPPFNNIFSCDEDTSDQFMAAA